MGEELQNSFDDHSSNMQLHAAFYFFHKKVMKYRIRAILFEFLGYFLYYDDLSRFNQKITLENHHAA